MSCEICPLVVGPKLKTEEKTQTIEVYDESIDLEETFEVCDNHANEILEAMEYHDRRRIESGKTICYPR